MKDIKFSTHFPKYHVRSGQPTHFVEKIWTALDFKFETIAVESFPVICEAHRNFYLKDWAPKRTTIRAGNRWKEGDWFIPKAWSGLPYRSKPYAFAPPLQVKKVEMVRIYRDRLPFDEVKVFLLSNNHQRRLTGNLLERFIADDGFDNDCDFYDWFNLKPGQEFEGQRIHFV